MHRPLRPLAALALAAATLSCGGGSSSSGPSQCLALQLEPDGLTVDPTRHSLVSAFFSVTCNGEPVPGLAASDFKLREDGELSSSFEAQVRIQPRGQKYRLFTALLLDLSGSVVKSADFPLLLASAHQFVDSVLAGDSGERLVAVYTFDGAAGIVPRREFTNDAQLLHAAIAGLAADECAAGCNDPEHATCALFAAGGGGRCVDLSTNLYGAVVNGLARLDDARAPTANPGIVFRDGALVVFTDGSDQAGVVQRALALQQVTRTPNRVFTIGLGAETDTGTLRQLGQEGFVPASRAEDLRPAFQRVADRIAGRANQFYLLEYCSPRRGGANHTLTVIAEHDGRTGALTTPFDATGFTSGCLLP